MIQFNFEGRFWRMRWRHPKEGIRVSECFLESFGEEGWKREEWQGWALLHPKDRFCRKTGRKVSLKHALVGHAEPFRKAAWEAFLLKEGCLTKEAA